MKRGAQYVNLYMRLMAIFLEHFFFFINFYLLEIQSFYITLHAVR